MNQSTYPKQSSLLFKNPIQPPAKKKKKKKRQRKANDYSYVVMKGWLRASVAVSLRSGATSKAQTKSPSSAEKWSGSE